MEQHPQSRSLAGTGAGGEAAGGAATGPLAVLTGVVEGQEDLARLSKLAEEASGGSQEPGDEVRLRVHTLSQIDAGVADTLSQGGRRPCRTRSP